MTLFSADCCSFGELTKTELTSQALCVCVFKHYDDEAVSHKGSAAQFSSTVSSCWCQS